MMSFSLQPSQRIVQYRFGNPHDVLEVESVSGRSGLSAGEVRVRVSRSIIHPGDLQLVESRYTQPAPSIEQGRVPGLEAAGIVEEEAPGALNGTGITIGTRVAFFAPGAWQHDAVVPAASLVPIPDDLPDGVAAQILINTVTARHVLRAGLRRLSAKPRHIVQTGAASAVARLLTVLAREEGLVPIRLVRSAESAKALRAVLPGADIIDTSSDGWQDEVRRQAAGDVTVVLDGVGGPLLGELAALLNVGGTVIAYGALGGRTADLNLFAPKALTLHGVTIGTWRADSTATERTEDLCAAIRIAREFPALFSRYREFGLSELSAAIDAVSAPGKTSNVILKF
ncbi:alcohol dehydrogenase catalytic domain-containing protein [Burkholderia gladioli]|uniref:alcohol dehydrogenase catalytic domain-containing protein n=1 Tax=Burkholderia gladioli TaxID=28095 RepID=UPI001ABB9CFB|nr:hypothetical protein [Burkholderia gladioli]